MKEFFKNIRISNFPKNLLIIFPAIISGRAEEIDLKIAVSSLFLFFLITSICYLINDFSDQRIDRKNKLKNNPNLSKEKFFLYLFHLILILFIFLIYLDQIYNYFLYLYICNFFIYNYFGKKIIYFDILLLTNFYLLRILYGVQVFDLEISLGFILFSISLFLGLSTIKRITQIKVNNLTKENTIISYNKSNIYILNYIFSFGIVSNVIIATLYFLSNLGTLELNNNLFIYLNNFSIEKLSLVYFIYLLLIINVLLNVIKSKINKDIYLYFITNKFNLFLFFITFFILIY